MASWGSYVFELCRINANQGLTAEIDWNYTSWSRRCRKILIGLVVRGAKTVVVRGKNRILTRNRKKPEMTVPIIKMADRSFDTLSGGERQRALIALALAQETKILVLDEPTNYLDPLHQLQIMEIIKELKRTTVVAMHDLNIAARYCDKIVLLDKGEIVVMGEPEKVLTKRNIRDVYGVDVNTKIDRKSGKLNIVFLGIHGT